MSADNAYAVELKGLTFKRGTRSIFNNVDIRIPRGKVTGIMGPSGCGKTTLLRLMGMQLRPSAGEVWVNGQNLPTLSRSDLFDARKHMGVLFQSGALFSSLTVTENIALPLIEHAGLSRPDAEHLACVKLALAGLPLSAADKYPSMLSGGMIKRAALARALALDPDILFLDEPTAGLDPIGAAAFDQLILTLRDAMGLSVFLVTHDLDTLYTITDRVAVLSQKRVLVAAPIKQVEDYDDPWIHEYFHGPRGRAAYEAATKIKEQ